MSADAEMKVRVPSATKLKIAVIAEARQQAMSVIVRDAIVEFVNDYERGHPEMKVALSRAVKSGLAKAKKGIVNVDLIKMNLAQKKKPRKVAAKESWLEKNPTTKPNGGSSQQA